MHTDPTARSVGTLCHEFGYEPEEVLEMSFIKYNFLVGWMNWANEMQEEAYRKAKGN